MSRDGCSGRIFSKAEVHPAARSLKCEFVTSDAEFEMGPRVFWTGGLLMLTLPVVWGLGLEPPVHDSLGRCSIPPFAALRRAESTALLARAASDTLAAGPGNVVFDRRTHPMRSDRSQFIYGQRFTVEDLSGAYAEVLRDVFSSRGSRDIVVVPWEHDEACQPALWPGSARWVPVGGQGAFVDLRLRPRHRWAQGIPTFDAPLGYYAPYPIAPAYRDGFLAEVFGSRQTLTPRMFLNLYLALPTREAAEEDPEAALRIIERWEATHVEESRRAPATFILRLARAAAAPDPTPRPRLPDRLRP